MNSEKLIHALDAFHNAAMSLSTVSQRASSEMHISLQCLRSVIQEMQLNEIYGRTPSSKLYKMHTAREAGIPAKANVIAEVRVDKSTVSWLPPESLLNKITPKALMDYTFKMKGESPSIFMSYIVPIHKPYAGDLQEAIVEVDLRAQTAKISFSNSAAHIFIPNINRYDAEVHLPLHDKPYYVALKYEWVDKVIVQAIFDKFATKEIQQEEFDEWILMRHYFYATNKTLEDVPAVAELLDLLEKKSAGLDAYDVTEVTVPHPLNTDISINLSLESIYSSRRVHPAFMEIYDFAYWLGWEGGDNVIKLKIIFDQSDKAAPLNTGKNNFLLAKDLKDNMDTILQSAISELNEELSQGID